MNTVSAIPRSIRAMLSALAAKEFSCEELVREMLHRCEEANRTLNCFITLQPDHTLAQARASDARRRAGRAGSLEGLPIAHKDIFCASGWPTTCGSHILKGFNSPYDAHLLTRLSGDGALLLGKTNMDEFAMGSSNETSFFGPVRNPWNHALVPGGSSGGSAAAVAAGLTPAATGTDTGGSIRQPAAFCGITGLKPTYGLISRFGMVAFASSLDQAGPFAHSAEDCALLLNSMAGFDPHDSTSIERPPEDYVAALRAADGVDSSRPLRGLTIGLPQEFFPTTLNEEIRRQTVIAVEALSTMGAEVVHLSLPRVDQSLPAYYVLAPAEASSNLSRFDGVRYGLRGSESSLADLYTDSRSQGFGDEVKRRILIGTYVLSQGYYDAYYLQAQKVRRLIAQDFDKAFTRCDLIVGPTTPTTAFALGSHQTDPVQMYLSDIFTIAASLAGLPALSLPCGYDTAGLPIGLQLIGPAFSEARLLSTAHRYQTATTWHLRTPTSS